MLQIARVTAFTVSELLRENQQGGGWGGGGVKLPPRPRLELKRLHFPNKVWTQKHY